MPIAAVPLYLQKNNPEFYLSSPPGHRFLLYLPIWGENGESGQVDWRKKDRVKKYKRQNNKLIEDGWDDIENGQYACAIAAGAQPPHDELRPRARKPPKDKDIKSWRTILDGLIKRQRAAFAARAGQEAALVINATTTAPFTTGLGNEHPLENGFAFLWPYGLPYLPGSGVKGVVRRTAEELAEGIWGDTCGWSHDPVSSIEHGTGADTTRIALSAIDVLFGREPQGKDSPAVRGVLTFWDVIPQIAGNSLMVEIMTPHQTHYYQQPDRPSGGSTSPHDSGQPNPISFLTIPPGSTFVFHVICDAERLKRIAPSLFQEENGTARWQNLLHTAFIHAFSWVGFGAKTAVGYGAMKISTPESPSTNQQKNLDIHQIQETTEQWPQAYLKYDPGSQKITATFEGRQATFLGQIHEFWQQLGEERTNRIKKKKSLGNIPIIVRKQGNYIEIIGINDTSC